MLRWNLRKFASSAAARAATGAAAGDMDARGTGEEGSVDGDATPAAALALASAAAAPLALELTAATTDANPAPLVAGQRLQRRKRKS